MADYKVTLTGAGASLMAKCLTGKALVFTAVQLGDGDVTVPFIEVEALGAVKKTLPVSRITRRGATAIVKAVLDFTSVTEDFQWREVGLIARDPDTGADVLYCYGNAGDRGDWITGGAAATAKRINITALVSETAKVTAVIDNSQLYASIEELERKADIDLSNVSPEAMRQAVENAGISSDIDGGIWDVTEVQAHNASVRSHGNLRLDGNENALPAIGDELAEHEVDPTAHGNMMLDGNGG